MIVNPFGIFNTERDQRHDPETDFVRSLKFAKDDSALNLNEDSLNNYELAQSKTQLYSFEDQIESPPQSPRSSIQMLKSPVTTSDPQMKHKLHDYQRQTTSLSNNNQQG